MKRILAATLAGVVASAGFPHARAAESAQEAVPAYLRANLSVCAPSNAGMRCLSNHVATPLSRTQARTATVKVSIYGRQAQGAVNSLLDKTPHRLRLVMAGSYYASDAPATLIRTWVGAIRGQQVWKLSSLFPTAPKGQHPYDLYYFGISVDGWPTLHTSTVRVTS